MKNIKLRFAARCEAAGRSQNEDNYLLDDDLSDPEWGFQTDKEIVLSDKGSLLVVCDGMGGMNAGEVASAIAVDMIKDCFRADILTDAIMNDDNSICNYIRKSIQKADEAIKTVSKSDEDKAGMGSTIVMAWILGKKVYVGWCGDSRAYRYNPQTGLERLSHDHSFVQELVDKGELSEELAFDHPNNNIITRSLGDPRGLAKPDVKVFDIHKDDIILLCSDGLCGCLRDREIFSIIDQYGSQTMANLRDALWIADEAAGWHDNVTTVIAQITDGPAMNKNTEGGAISRTAELRNKNNSLKVIIGILCVLLIGLFVFLFFKPNHEPTNTDITTGTPADSLVQDSIPTTSDSTADKKQPSKKDEVGLRKKTIQKEQGKSIDKESPKEQIAETDTTSSKIGNGLTKIDEDSNSNDNKNNAKEGLSPIDTAPKENTDTTNNLTPIK